MKEGQMNIQMGKVTLNYLQLLPHIMFFLKINSRWTVNLNVSGKKMKLLENNTEYLHDLQVGINKTTNKVDYVKIKNICSSKKNH